MYIPQIDTFLFVTIDVYLKCYLIFLATMTSELCVWGGEGICYYKVACDSPILQLIICTWISRIGFYEAQ